MLTVRAILKNGTLKFIDDIPSDISPEHESFVLVTFVSKDINSLFVGKPETAVDVKLYNKLKVGLSEREIDVLKLAQQGLTNEQIGEKLDIGHGTVRNYMSSVYEKLKANNRTEAVFKATELGLLD